MKNPGELLGVKLEQFLCKLDSGYYQLILHFARKYKIKVGSLGEVEFPTGYYIYTGSARRNLKSRLLRHCRKDKRMHWHIDYIHPEDHTVAVIIYDYSNAGECYLNKQVLSVLEESSVIIGFGSSDCRCPGHLIYSSVNPLPALSGQVPCFIFDLFRLCSLK